MPGQQQEIKKFNGKSDVTVRFMELKDGRCRPWTAQIVAKNPQRIDDRRK
jgi:hypothetical protein